MSSVKFHPVYKILYTGILSILLIWIAAEGFDLRSPSPDAPYLSNIYAFSFELGGNPWQTPEAWIDSWFFNAPPPFKYRLLGKLPIYITYHFLLSNGFDKLIALYAAYTLWTGLFLFTFLWSAARFCECFIGYANRQGFKIFFLSSTLIALSAPVFWAFKFPVHGSPNDFLGYTLISLALIALMKNHLFWFLVFCMAGIFCRETCLIVLLPFCLNKNIGITRKLGNILLLAIIFICYRHLWPGYYNPFDGAKLNWRFPLESLSFLFLTFGPFWLTSFIGYQLICIHTKDDNIKAFNFSFMPAVITVLVVVFLLARVREIRIEFILFAYFIPYSVFYIQQRHKEIISFIFSIAGLIATIAVALILVRVYFIFTPITVIKHQALLQLFNHFYTGFGGGWIKQFLAYLAVFLFLLFFELTKLVRIYQYKKNLPQHKIKGNTRP